MYHARNACTLQQGMQASGARCMHAPAGTLTKTLCLAAYLMWSMLPCRRSMDRIGMRISIVSLQKNAFTIAGSPTSTMGWLNRWVRNTGPYLRYLAQR